MTGSTLAPMEERLQILNLIQSGQITAEEGARLLEALTEREAESSAEEPEGESPGKSTRWIRIRVSNLKTGQQKVDMRMPWSLISVGLNMGARFSQREICVDELAEVVQSGAEGKIVDIRDEEENERVEIIVE
jgi:polyhydroxyalkanoate synthesis regulator phasin